MRVRLYIKAEVRDANGRVTKRIRERRSHSFTIQFLQHLECMLKDTNVTITDIAGSGRTVQRPSQGLFRIFFGNAIQTGLSTTPPTNTDFKINTLSALTASSLVKGTTQIVAGNVDWPQSQAFQNNTGSTIVVEEVGLFLTSVINVSGGIATFMIAHDLFNVSVVAGGSTTITYTLRTSA